MALTLTEKSDIRRHLRYPPAGLYRVSVSGGTLAGVDHVVLALLRLPSTA